MEQHYRIREVAEKLQVSQSAVRHWVRVGVLGHVRVGRVIRIVESAVRDFLERGGEKRRSGADG